MAIASRMTLTMQTDFRSRSSYCHGFFTFIIEKHWYHIKLRSTSFPLWSLANGRQSRLKALLNDCFLLILLDEKERGDRRLIRVNKGTKVGKAFSEYALFIIWFYESNLCFPGTGVGVCKDDHIGKGENNLSEGDPGTYTHDKDRANNPGIRKLDVDKANNLGTRIPDPNGANDLGTRAPDIDKDGRADNSSRSR